MDTQSALSYASAAPFIALLLAYVFSTVPTTIDHKYIPLCALALTTIWGVVLWQSNYWEGTAAVFIVTDITVAYAVGGIMSQARNIGTVNFVPAPKLPQLSPDEVAIVSARLAQIRAEAAAVNETPIPAPSATIAQVTSSGITVNPNDEHSPVAQE